MEITHPHKFGRRCRWIFKAGAEKIEFTRVWGKKLPLAEIEKEAAIWEQQTRAAVKLYESKRSEWEVLSTIDPVAAGEPPRKPKGGNGKEDIQWMLSCGANKVAELKAKTVRTMVDVFDDYQKARLLKPKKERTREDLQSKMKMFGKCVKPVEVPGKYDDEGWLLVFSNIRKELDAARITGRNPIGENSWLNKNYRIGEEYSAAYKNFQIKTLSGLMRYCRVKLLMASMPLDEDIKKRETVRVAPKVIPVNHLSKLWDVAYNADRFKICLGLNCAFYMADIGQLRAENVDMVEGRIKGIREKTKNEEMGVPYNFPMWEETKFWMQWMLSYQKRMKHESKDGYLFCTREGKSLENSYFYTWKRMNLRAGLGNDPKGKPIIYTFSCLRDTASDKMDDISPIAADILLRHSTGKTMRKHYIPEGKPDKMMDAYIMELKNAFPFLNKELNTNTRVMPPNPKKK